VSDERDHQQSERRRYRIAGLGDRQGAQAPTMAGHVDDLVAAYALGALDADEAAAVDAHIRGCRDCERDLGNAERTAGMLAYTAPLYSPAPDVKAALFSRVSHTQRAAAAASLPTHQLSALRTPALPSSADLDLVPGRVAAAGVAATVVAPASGPSRTGWLATAVSMPLLVALVAVGFWGIQLQNQMSSRDAQVAELQAELANFGSGTTSYLLSPGEAAPQAEGSIIMGADKRAGAVQIDVNTDQGPREFELLVNKDGKLVPAGEIQVNQAGQGQARFELEQPFDEYESVHIKAIPANATSDAQDDTLLWGSEGSLGSTGSGLELVP
jgi:anti-sigma factor RsiW